MSNITKHYEIKFHNSKEIQVLLNKYSIDLISVSTRPNDDASSVDSWIALYVASKIGAYG